MATIIICSHCGERRTMAKEETSKVKIYCARCETPEGRKKVDDENAKIREELKLKGYKVPEAIPENAITVGA